MDINFNKLTLVVLFQLLNKQAPLNKSEIQFIRKFLGLTKAEFGNIFGVSHVAVVNWEKGTNRIAPATDIYLRLYLLDYLKVKDKEFRRMYSKMSLETLSKSKDEKITSISIDLDEDLETA